MRTPVVIAVMLLLLTGCSVAQVPTAGNVFFGYSYQSADSTALNIIGGNRVNMNGWEATLEGKVVPFLGIVADFSGHYGSQGALTPIGGVNVTGHQLTVMFGPRVGVSIGKFRPFAEFELGVGHMNTNALGSNTSFADAIGGGLDYKLVRLVALRIGADELSTRFFGRTQNNFRLSTGIAVHF